MTRPRDIDYAAITVKAALVEKFGRQNDLENLTVTANENTITVRDGRQSAEGTRDNLLAAVRKVDAYADYWQAVVPPRE